MAAAPCWPTAQRTVSRIVKGVLGGVAAGELAAQEGVSREAIRLVREEFRCDLGQLDGETQILDGYPVLRRAVAALVGSPRKPGWNRAGAQPRSEESSR